jgi:hypothetical protein
MKFGTLTGLLLLCATMLAQVALDPRYHTYDEILDEIFALQDSFPDLVMVQQIGSSLGADPYQDPMPIYAVKLSQNVTVNEDEPNILFLGPSHAEEILGNEINMFMLNEIITYRNVQPFNIWLQNLQIWIVPCYNPEGLQVVMDDWDETYRKNKRDNNLNGIFDFEPGSGGDIDGVDLNRNYGFNWIHGESLYAGSGEEWNDYYRGPGPFSEGETQAVRDLGLQYKFLFSIAWHSSRTGNLSERVIYPSEWNVLKKNPDFLLSQNIGTTVASLIQKQNPSGSSQTYEPYASQGRNGNAHDWFYKANGTIQLLIECGTQNMQPNNDPPLYLIDDTCQRNRLGAYWLLNRALGYNTSAAMLTGHITDAVSGEPLVARYLIDEKQAGYFDPHYSDADFGRYWRPISVGTYTLRAFKKGYEPAAVTATVNNSQWTIRDLQLQPLNPVVVNGHLISNGNPLNGTIIIDNGAFIQKDVLEVIDGQFDFAHFEGDYQLTVIAEGYVHRVIDVSFPSGNYDLVCEMEPAIEIYREDFETDLSGWDISGDWALVNNSHTGNLSVTDSPDVFYVNGSVATLTMQEALNLNGAGSDLVLELWHKYHTEHDYDFCYLQFSADGYNWTTIATWDGFSDGWQRDIIAVPQLTDSFIKLRFRLETDSSLDDPGWWIDEIKLLSSVAADTNITIPPVKTELYDNFPNPFNPSTKIKYDLMETDLVELCIFNIKGQKIRTLINSEQESGSWEVTWNGRDDENRIVASGIYFYRLKTRDFEKSKRMALLK